jgi:hypothetical protein
MGPATGRSYTPYGRGMGASYPLYGWGMGPATGRSYTPYGRGMGASYPLYGWGMELYPIRVGYGDTP